MLKLRRDINRAVMLLELIKRREKIKKEKLVLIAEVFEKRYQTKDYSGEIISEVSVLANLRPCTLLYSSVGACAGGEQQTVASSTPVGPAPGCG